MKRIGLFLWLLVAFLFAACTKEEPMERIDNRTAANHRVSVEEALDELDAVLSFIDPQTRRGDSVGLERLNR